MKVDDVDLEIGQDTTIGPSKVLHIAAYRADLEEVRRLTEEEHLSPLLSDEYGRNALHDAAQGGNKNISSKKNVIIQHVWIVMDGLLFTLQQTAIILN